MTGSWFSSLMRAWIYGLFVAGLVACGSGGGDGGTTVPVVDAPRITTEPASVAVNEGQPASFSVVASSTGLLYQWRRNGADIAGATAATYPIANPTLGDSGARFSVRVSNISGAVTSADAVLTVANTVAITTQPASTSVFAGDAAEFQVTATGTAPVTYQWRRNGVDVAGATLASYTTPATVQADNGAVYSVAVSNVRGTLASANATLTLLPPEPVVVRGPEPASVVAGSAVTFSVFASGAAPFTYQWQRNGVAIAGATQSTYTFTTALADNNSAYRVVVNNRAGSVTSAAAPLSVSAVAQNISIIRHPQNLTVRDRERPTFNVEIAGTGPFTVVWLRNGVEIETTRLFNVNSTQYALSFQAFLATDNGALYSMRISNASGSVTTLQGLLTVTP